MSMQDLLAQNQAINKRTEDFPTQTMFLTATTKRPQPVAHHLRPERLQRGNVAGDGNKRLGGTEFGTETLPNGAIS